MTLRWGLIGYGDLAEKRGAAALQEAPGSRLEAVWGRHPERTTDFAGRHDIPRACRTLDELCTLDLDAVYVCTPPDSHLEYARAALAAGKHVLVEKPVAASAAEARQMVKAAEDAGRTLGVAFYRRAYPKMQQVKALITAGVLGVPTWVNIAAHSWFNPAPDDPKYWRVQRAHSGGGGAVADIGVHRLDLLDFWMGPSRVCWSGRQKLVQPYEVEDGCSAILELANGAPVHCYFAWNSKTFIDRFEIVGSEGKIILDSLDGPSLVVIRGREREELALDPPANPHLPCVADFCAAVRDGRPALCDGNAGLRTQQLLQLITGGE